MCEKSLCSFSRELHIGNFLMLGKGDSFSQKGYFATSKDALEKLYAEAENNCKKYVHLYIKLGFLCGLTLLILLI